MWSLLACGNWVGERRMAERDGSDNLEPTGNEPGARDGSSDGDTREDAVLDQQTDTGPVGEVDQEPVGEAESTAEAAAHAQPDIDGPAAQESGSETRRPVENAAPAATPRRGGSGLALLALAVSLVVLGFVSYPYWPVQPFPLEAESNTRLLERAADERDRLALRVETLEASSRVLAEELGVARSALEALDGMALERSAAMADLETKFNESFASAINAAPPSARDWRLAEAEYLLRVAGHRAVMEQDFDGAIGLMTAADDVLLELDEPQLAEVRQLLAVELLNLRAVESTDVNGIFLRLEALKPLITSLPLRLPMYSGSSDEAQESTPSTGVIDRLFGLIEFRRHDLGATKPLLAPEEAEYVEQHLLAAFDRAQLSALRRDPELFRASLGSAEDLLAAYLDPGNANVLLMRNELEALAATDLAIDVPAVGDALVRLRELREMLAPAPRGGQSVPDGGSARDGRRRPIEREDLSAENVS